MSSLLKLKDIIEKNVKTNTMPGNPSHIVNYNNNSINILLKNEVEEEFYRVYSDVINNELNILESENINIYEYRSLEFPLVISIKKKYCNKKNISEDNFKILIKMVRNVLVNYLDYNDYNLLDCNIDLLNCIVMETSKNYNIIFPYFITNYQIQKYIKDNIIEQEKNILKIRNVLNIYQEVLFNVFDDNVYDISKYKWLLYSCGDNKLIYRFDSNCNKIDCSKFNVYQLIILTSMRVKKNNNDDTENINISKIIKTNQDKIVIKNKEIIKKLTIEMRDKLRIYKIGRASCRERV